MSKFLSTFTLLMMLMPAESMFAQIKLPRLLDNNAILQREIQLPLRGQAAKKSRVSIVFAGNSYETRADKNGQWEIKLLPLAAGGPFQMRISDKNEILVLDNILIGDVWVCSGQSNMEWALREANNAEAEIAAANDPMIRQFYVEHTASMLPLDTLKSGSWNICGPATAGDFTAVGYFSPNTCAKKRASPSASSTVPGAAAVLNPGWMQRRLDSKTLKLLKPTWNRSWLLKKYELMNLCAANSAIISRQRTRAS
ncbi:MAG: hypothetical protein SGI94_06615 [Saprospiraceae bacterium]|nr:hypothetical protein [Saprospiraceae bacterium]